MCLCVCVCARERLHFYLHLTVLQGNVHVNRKLYNVRCIHSTGLILFMNGNQAVIGLLPSCEHTSGRVLAGGFLPVTEVRRCGTGLLPFCEHRLCNVVQGCLHK